MELTAKTGEREYARDGADGGQQPKGSSFPQGHPSGPGGKGSRSLWRSGTAAQHDSEAPTGLQAENVEAGVLLCWETPEVDAGGVTGFRILTRQPKFGEAFYTLVDDTGTSYADPSADEVDTLYAYQVQTLCAAAWRAPLPQPRW